MDVFDYLGFTNKKLMVSAIEALITKSDTSDNIIAGIVGKITEQEMEFIIEFAEIVREYCQNGAQDVFKYIQHVSGGEFYFGIYRDAFKMLGEARTIADIDRAMTQICEHHVTLLHDTLLHDTAKFTRHVDLFYSFKRDCLMTNNREHQKEDEHTIFDECRATYPGVFERGWINKDMFIEHFKQCIAYANVHNICDIHNAFEKFRKIGFVIPKEVVRAYNSKLKCF